MTFDAQLLKHVTIPSGGVLANIRPELLKRRRGAKSVSASGFSQPKPTKSLPAKKRKVTALSAKFAAKGKTAAKGSSKVNMLL